MMERHIIIALAVLSLIGFIDAISYMAVAPSLIFYVQDLAGTKEQYGLIMSSFSFASFCFKPVYGRWVDSSGNKYKIPYLVSFSLAIFGNLLYFSAVLVPTFTSTDTTTMNIGVYTLLVARLFAGMGAANNTLGYSYIATVIPHEQQTTTNVLLSMVRIVGMSAGPFVNLLLSKIDTTITIFNTTIPLNPYNSVGLMVAGGQLFVLLVTLILLSEPNVKEKELSLRSQQSSMSEIWDAVFSFDIILSLIIIFVVNCNFQLIETAFPPASAHGLGWGPVQTSSVMGANSIIIFFLMAFVMFLSIKKFSDYLLVIFGNIIWVVGGSLMYYLWTYQAPAWHFVLPISLSVAGFPFIASSNRSIFTKAVKNKPELESVQSMMQAIMSMGASIGGFLAPSLVAIFVIRDAEEVEASTDKRELSPTALYVPIASGLCIIGLWYQWLQMRAEDKTEEETTIETPSEKTKLVTQKPRSERRPTTVVEMKQEFSRQNEVRRRQSVEIMGVPCPYESSDEHKEREMIWKEKQNWEELHRLGEEDDD